MSNLENKIAIITGAGSGIGEATAKLFAKKRIKVAIADLDEASLQRVASEIEAEGHTVLPVIANVSKVEDLTQLVEKTIAIFGTVDFLINNAGIMDNFVAVDELEIKLWEKVMDVNVKGPTILSQLAVRHWLQRKKPGVIVNIASVGGMFGARGGVSYVTSKHAVIGLTKNIAAVYRENNIRAVAIAPGSIKTNIGNTLRNPDKKGLNALTHYVSNGPLGETTDVANVIAFLVSDEAEFVNGTVVTVDGGWTGA